MKPLSTSFSPQVTELLLGSPIDLVASQLNPRKRFLQGKLLEMADSVREHGVQVPLKARPLADGSGKLEIIWGERRWRGAMMVYQGYEDAAGQRYEPQPDLRIPVMVEEMSDEVVFELMVLENLQREDLTPSEEGAAYVRLIEDYGLSQREVARRLGMPLTRVQRYAGIMDLPNGVLDRLDGGELPLYVALEALRVPAEWSGGDARMEALKLAEEAGSPARAHDLVEARYLRPAREAATWESPETMATLVEKYGEGVERLSYRTCRELWPAGVTTLTPVTAGHFVPASEVPKAPLVHFETTLTWGEMARTWGAPLYAGCDGGMGSVLLTRADLVAEAGRSRHTYEVELGETEDGGWRWMAPVGALKEGDRVALLKLTSRGEVPQGTAPGRLYVVADLAMEEEGMVSFDLTESKGGGLVVLHGGTEARLGLLDVSACPFLPVEGRMAVEALRLESEEEEAQVSAAEREREALLVSMLGEAVMGIRGAVEQGQGSDALLGKAVQFLAVAGSVGLTGAEHPSNRLMALLEVPEEGEDEAQFATWEGLSGEGASRAGVESFAVGSWLLYWLDGWEGADLRKCENWLVVRKVYGF